MSEAATAIDTFHTFTSVPSSYFISIGGLAISRRKLRTGAARKSDSPTRNEDDSSGPKILFATSELPREGNRTDVRDPA